MVGTKSIESVLHIAPVLSSEMQSRIELWEDMYTGHSPWIKEPTYEDPSRVASLGLPQMIASEKARTALLEFESEITTPMKEIEVEQTGDNIVERFNQSNTEETNNKSSEATESENQADNSVKRDINKYNTAQFHPQATVKELVPKGPTERAEYLNKTYQVKVLRKLRKEIEYGIALGGLVIKPYAVENVNPGKKNKDKYDMNFDFVYATDFYPLAFNSSGDVVEAAFLQRKRDKDVVYTRLEHHKLVDHIVTITNTAYKSTNTDMASTDLGEPILLGSVPEWASIQEVVTIEDVDRLLFAYFKMPEANNIDIYSPLGVSGFDKAIPLIKDADMQYSSLLWEYEGGELAIDIDRDALRDFYSTDEKGNRILKSGMGHLQQRLYRPVELDAEGDTYNQYAPALRDSSYISGLNTILMHIEDVTGLSRGTLSEVDVTEARTATELRILKQRSFQTNKDIQDAIKYCLEDLVYVMNVLCDLYEITPDGEYNISFEFDDSILVDKNEELGRNISLMNEGIMSKLELRMWYKGETEKQAREALLKVQEENRVAVEENIMTQMDMRDVGLDSSIQQSPDNFRQGNNE